MLRTPTNNRLLVRVYFVSGLPVFDSPDNTLIAGFILI